jgi:hypothetical protein
MRSKILMTRPNGFCQREKIRRTNPTGSCNFLTRDHKEASSFFTGPEGDPALLLNVRAVIQIQKKINIIS